MRERRLDGIGRWELTKNCLALTASVQALSDHEDVERQYLTVLKEDSDVADWVQPSWRSLASSAQGRLEWRYTRNRGLCSCLRSSCR